MRSPPTLRDVARAAGVHFTTVGLVLRNDPRIRAETAARVRAAVAKLGYRPNPMFAALMAGVRRGSLQRAVVTIAFCSSWDQGDGWFPIRTHRLYYDGARQRAEDSGYRIERFDIGRRGIRPERLNQILRTRNIRGVILANFQYVTSELTLEWPEFSVVRIDPNPKNPHLDTISTNHHQLVRLAFRQALARGYERIALATNRLWDERLDEALISGFLTEQRGLPARRRVRPFYTVDWSADALAKWLRTAKPDAIIAMNAPVVLKWLESLGLRAPDDLGFISLDQVDDTGYLAGIRKDHSNLGAGAVDILVGKLQHNERGIPTFPRTTLISGRWIDGTSVRPLVPGARDPSFSLG